MSRVDFSIYRDRFPELAAALDTLQRWLSENPHVRDFDPARLAREIRDVAPADIALALSVLVSVGRLKLAYRVRAPESGTLLAEQYESIEAIPRELRDVFHTPFNLDDAEVVPVFTESGR